MVGWLRWAIGLFTRTETHFPLLSLPEELVVMVLSHLVNLEFQYFRNTLIAFPELNELVICVTNCPEAASGILKGVQCVQECEYERIMSTPSTKKPLAIMIVSPYVPHRGEIPRPLSWMGTHRLLDHMHTRTRDTVVGIFITLNEHVNLTPALQTELELMMGITRFNWLKSFPSTCSCAGPIGYMEHDPIIYTYDCYDHRVTAFTINFLKKFESLWLGRGRWFPYSLLRSCELFPRLKHLYIDMKRNGWKDSIDCSQMGTIINFEAPVLETLTVSFWTLQCPIINGFAYPNEKPPDKKCSGKELVVHNMHWSSKAPCGMKKGCNVSLEHDQFECSMASFKRPGVNPSFMFDSYVLIGVPDKFLVHVRWDCVKSLYWKRLEPAFARPEAKPIVLRCPSLKHLKIYHLVSSNVPLMKFDVPALEQLVLVSLADSTLSWDVLKLLNHQWPRTLSKLTVSTEVFNLYPQKIIFSDRIVPPEPVLTHMWIQRLDLILKGIVFRRLVYLDLDVTAIPVSRPETEPAVRMTFKHSQYPVLKELILSMPQLSNVKNIIIGVPVLVYVPDTCQCIGVATMLAMRSISVNGQALRRPPKFVQRPLLEVFTCYTKEDGLFEATGEMMAGRGESLDTLLQTQHRDFNHVKRHCRSLPC